VENDSALTIPVSFDASIDRQAASAEEIALIAAFLPELVKEMLVQSEPEGD
jgi:hypothetical protein